MAQTLELGSSKRKITPQIAVSLAGFANRTQLIEEISHDLYLQCFSLTDCGREVIVISADLIWWGEEIISLIRSRLKKKYGLKSEQIFLHGTHTHCGPQTSNELSAELGVAHPNYLEWLVGEVLSGVVEARGQRETVFLQKSSSETFSLGIHRRKETAEGIEMLPNTEIAIDQGVWSIGFTNLKGICKALWVFGECHPTISDLVSISSEFPGRMCQKLERNYPEMVVAFFQGACGDIRPCMVDVDGRFFKGTVKDIDYWANELAVIVEKNLTDLANQEKEAVKIEYDEQLVLLPLQNQEYKTMRVKKIVISQGVVLLGVNAEIVQFYRLQLANQFPDKKIALVGYSNGMIGYLATREQIIAGGYEGEGFAQYFNLSSPFVPEIEDKILLELTNMIDKGEIHEI